MKSFVGFVSAVMVALLLLCGAEAVPATKKAQRPQVSEGVKE
jgi:hypothetical protein